MQTGIIVKLLKDGIDERIKQVRDLGFDCCQLTCWDMTALTQEVAAQVRAALDKYNVRLTTLWCGWEGPRKWNFTEGPLTLGLVPRAYRYVRMNNLKRGSEFAKLLGVDKIATHVGYIPENPNDENYREIVCALQEVVSYCKGNGQFFLFETGQETPVTILRVIEDIGYDNVGVNLDPANLILYGKGNPIDSLDVFGKYVMDVHAKDGFYPTNGKNLGREVKVGEGKVNFPEFIKKLREVGYDGSLIIEREISGPQQIEDIKSTKIYLEKLIEA